jgi:hypothetical protein
MGYGAGKFSQESYDKNDELAKEIFIKYITTIKEHKIINSEENYDHDVITEKDGKTFYFELEMKRNYPWTSRDDFKFDSVSFLGRKLRLHNKHKFKYIIICAETLCAVGCDSNIIYNDNYKQNININKYDRKGFDTLYRVPSDLCKFFNLNT